MARMVRGNRFRKLKLNELIIVIKVIIDCFEWIRMYRGDQSCFTVDLNVYRIEKDQLLGNDEKN